jgi:ankyrin repeat protein
MSRKRFWEVAAAVLLAFVLAGMVGWGMILKERRARRTAELVRVLGAYPFPTTGVDRLVIGADPNVRAGRLGITPLVFAAEKGDVWLARWLLSHGADANQTDGLSRTPLICALKSKDAVDQLALVEMLVESGADVNATDAEGVSPLMCAVNDPRLVELLLEKGANPEVPDGAGQTAYDYARQNGGPGVLRILLDHSGPDPRIRQTTL